MMMKNIASKNNLALDHKLKKPQFSSETSWPLKTHNTEKHESGGQKICLYCDYRTKDLKSIKYHIDTKHPEHGPKKHFCNLCDKGFMFEGSLKFHMAQHKHKEKLKTELGYSKFQKITDILKSQQNITETW